MSYAPPYKEYSPNGTDTRFVFEFELNRSDDLQVYFTPAGHTPNEKNDLIDSSEYTVTIVPPPAIGGHIDFTTAPASGGHLVLRRGMVLTNPTSFENVATFNGKAIDSSFKRLELMVQENNFDAADRALHYPTNAKNLLQQETELPILGDNQFWKKVNGSIAAVTIDDDPSSLRSELASKTQTSPGAALVGFYNEGAIPTETDVDAVLKTLLTNQETLLTNQETLLAKAQGTDVFTKAVVDINYPVGSIFMDGNGTLTPPGQGVNGIAWQDVTETQGHLLVGASQSGDWAVNPGATRGSTQSCDPMTLSNLKEHSHFCISNQPGNDTRFTINTPDTTTIARENITYNTDNTLNATSYTLSGGGDATREPSIGPTSSTGSQNPDGIGLTNLKMYGVKNMETNGVGQLEYGFREFKKEGR